MTPQEADARLSAAIDRMAAAWSASERFADENAETLVGLGVTARQMLRDGSLKSEVDAWYLSAVANLKREKGCTV